MRKMNMALLIGSLTLLTACASTGDRDYGYKDGWRRAEVLDLGDAQSASLASSQDCRVELGDKATSKRFALVSYSYGGNPKLRHRRTVMVPDDLQVEKGERLYVNIKNCALPSRRMEVSPR